MLLEHFKIYLDGMGNAILVELTKPDSDFPFTGDNGLTYTASGHYFDDSQNSIMDLVDEI